jgi:myxalamid-type polyketide synthase MxaE and MxaD
LRSGGDAERVVGDVRVSDEAGRLLVEVVGLELRRVTPATLLRGADAGIRNWLYRIEWRPVPAPRTGSLASDGRWLVFTDRGELGLAAAELLRFHGARATLVAPGSDYERSSDDAVRFDMSRPELFDRLFRELDPVTGVLHLASLDHRVADGLPHREDAEAALLECRTLLHTVQAALRHRGASPRLWIVTRGARAVRADEPLPGLCQAPLWGFGAVLANEQPEIWGGMVDLDPAGAASEPADLLEVLTSEPSEPLTAFRGGERHRPSVVPLAIDMPPEPLTLRSDASYLITGGLGALGMRVAQWLVEAGARDLVLAGRRPPAAADAQRIAAWRDRGLLVEVAALDVADGPAVRALIAKLYQDGRPLAGVVHAAGVLRDRTLSRQSWDHFVAVTDPKIHGLVALLEGIGDARLDFFVCFSSISALLGNPGQVNYAAANAFLDACAHHLRAEGIRALSIGWGAWASMGMAARYGEHLWRHWGLSPMNGHQAVRALDALVRTDLPQCYVSPVDWVQFAARRPQAATGLFSEVAAPEDAAEASPPSDHALRLELAGSSAEERVALMLAHVRQVAMRLLRRDDIQVHERLEELGLDSLLQIDLVRALEQSTGLTLPTTLVFQYPTPYEIASYLSSEMESELARGEA